MSHTHSECLIINDRHKAQDPEFRFIPPHADCAVTQAPLANYEQYIKVPYQVSFKDTMNALCSEHNKKLILDRYDTIDLCGFNITTDVVPTALGLLDCHQKFAVIDSCCGDCCEELRIQGLNYLKVLGIEIK